MINTCPIAEGMLTPGLPLVFTRTYYHNGQPIAAVGDDAVCLRRSLADPAWALLWIAPYRALESAPLDALGVDLSAEIGEQAAVSWCAEQVGKERRGASLHAAGEGCWMLQDLDGSWVFFADSLAPGSTNYTVPALAGIPATDEGRLRAVAVIVEHLIAEHATPSAGTPNV